MRTITSTIVSTPGWTEMDHRFMLRALELARKGSGQVSPGPLVGCVIVDALGAIVGEGFYVFEGVKHAETIALSQAGDKARGGTAYVSLEPHAHQARTPPCTDALIEAGIGRVVAPIQDLNPKVSGSGFAHLRDAGIDVQIGLLAEEAERINEVYLHFMRTGRPFVHLKSAVSLDGKIATRTGDSRWITGSEARARAHELRHHYDSVLVGLGTAIVDNPLLTDRSGSRRSRPLVRIVLDDRLQLSTKSQLVQTARETSLLVFSAADVDDSKAKELEANGVEIVRNDTHDLWSVLDELGHRSLLSVLVEGGAGVAGRFVEAGLVNKATFFIAPKIIGGREAPSAVGGKGVELLRDALKLEDIEVTQHGDDLEVTGYPRSGKE
ncbi:MAG TPA: bifunctional diaminohydroxyphosphoribosylaminopyrimidine deaminase/5-amino-6-(5-phosphoribosylamino)uracil reductase RibD [Pyrinomonadaceae bacterium]|nr:bifunctional diaminohydroxyphosphoribosylaminopyrimidine deaminase/5-amino-6-(5-phosphoribosylamino)uracil reductase RibD [Pyrinomonadaceae bacterium]